MLNNNTKHIDYKSSLYSLLYPLLYNPQKHPPSLSYAHEHCRKLKKLYKKVASLEKTTFLYRSNSFISLWCTAYLLVTMFVFVFPFIFIFMYSYMHHVYIHYNLHFIVFHCFCSCIRIKKLLIREGNEAKNYKQKGVQNVKLTKKIKLSFSFKPKSMCEKCEAK